MCGIIIRINTPSFDHIAIRFNRSQQAAENKKAAIGLLFFVLIRAVSSMSIAMMDAEDTRQDSISSRAGYLPISLARLPIKALAGISVYIRTSPAEAGSDPTADPFTLLCAGNVAFDEDARRRLLKLGTKFVYIPTAAHDQFRKQTESQIENIAKDTEMASAAKWAIVFETTNEIANELLSQRNFAANVPRLQAVSKAVSSIVLSDPSAFTHLFAASHHDFYTATHMVNVGTWMVALAYAMGHKDEQELCNIFQAGILHDVGKTLVPREILNKTGQLTSEEWAILRSHPTKGSEYLKQAGVTDPVILAVTHQHHERLDGSGYPDNLRADQMHPIAKMCAVIDTFDAMTSLRPFKTRAMPVAQAMAVIIQESPLKYDAQTVAVWGDLVKSVNKNVPEPVIPAPVKKVERRKSSRSDFNCPVLVRVKEEGGRFEDAVSINAVTHDVSSGGMALLLPMQVSPGQLIRLHLQPPKKIRITRTYTAECVRCRPYDDGWFEIGVELLSEAA
jgi:HD-GYP domain-containing protein (c-di-GMP phosphodiesterase class II)